MIFKMSDKVSNDMNEKMSQNDNDSLPYAFIDSTIKDNPMLGFPDDFIELMSGYFRMVTWNDVQREKSISEKVVAGFVRPPTHKSLQDNLHIFKNLKVIANFGVGVDHIKIPLYTEKGIKVANTPDVLAPCVADMGLMLILATARNLKTAMAEACAPSLPNNSFNGNALGVDVCEATLGIIGMGSIGYKIAQRAKGFDMKILYYNRSRRPEEIENSVGATFVPKLHDLLPQCDFVVVICPLSAETKGLIGAEEFNLMKPTATIVNIARGGVIDTEALVAALKEKKIRGAGLDVTDPEPLPRGHVLFDFPNVIVTPHHASATVQTRMKMARLMLANVLACLEGRPMPTPVN
ncbi:unnamed protein product [Owenia fusiformis]|uniref:Uncharacterized protein n=1 Tax=Owenia fusiformis TaxID=6347 RepID=A0A8S4NF03_OWEFU|nr:unnamed protein product [Owenia fusiformis]